jgi:hypothetical protein
MLSKSATHIRVRKANAIYLDFRLKVLSALASLPQVARDRYRLSANNRTGVPTVFISMGSNLSRAGLST